MAQVKKQEIELFPQLYIYIIIIIIISKWDWVGREREGEI